MYFVKSEKERELTGVFLKMVRGVYNWFTNIMPPTENPEVVNNFIQWLNRTYSPGPWVALQGFTALTVAVPGSNNTATFNPSSGFLLKSFRNTSTGEIKSFEAHRFYVA